MQKPCSSIEARSFTRLKMEDAFSARSTSRRIAAMKSFREIAELCSVRDGLEESYAAGVIGLH
jgi:hypothetical protein